MKLYLTKNSEKTKHEFSIDSYKILQEPQSIFLLKIGTLSSYENGEDLEEETLEIFKVQFIANCKTEFADNVIIAFFIDDHFSELRPYIIDSLSLPGNYYQEFSCYLIDYRSYAQICDLTNEAKLSFIEYCNKVLIQSNCVNTLVKYDQEYKLLDSLL